MRRFTPQNLLPRPSDNIELVERQRHGKGRRRRIGNHQSCPVRRDPITVGNARARRGAIPGQNHVMAEINRRQIG
jgi:hypothetical protein